MRYFFNIFEFPRLGLSIDSIMIKDDMSGTFPFVRKPFCSRKEDHEESGMFSRASMSALLTSLLAQVLWDGCRLAGYVVQDRSFSLISFRAKSEVRHKEEVGLRLLS